MGYFRFLLAALVMLSHLPGTSYRVNYGQMAVLGFYFISGYLMAMIFARFRARSTSPVRDFYVDRIFKLWPAYALVLLITFAFFNWSGIRVMNLSELGAEIFILPNAYGKLFWLPNNYYLIPPTWSLGVEAHFYLVVPLLAVLSLKRKVALAYVLTFAHLAALASRGAMSDLVPRIWPVRPTIDQIPISDYLGFDLPFLIGVTFLVGWITYESFIVRKEPEASVFAIWAIYAFSLFFLFPYKAWIQNLSANEALMSITIFLPIAAALLVLTHSQKPSMADRAFGGVGVSAFPHALPGQGNHRLFPWAA